MARLRERVPAPFGCPRPAAIYDEAVKPFSVLVLWEGMRRDLLALGLAVMAVMIMGASCAAAGETVSLSCGGDAWGASKLADDCPLQG